MFFWVWLCCFGLIGVCVIFLYMFLFQLESWLCYEFCNVELLCQVLIYCSYSVMYNEWFEFFGDFVLNCVVVVFLFQCFGKLDEGDLLCVCVNFVKQQLLYEIVQVLNILDGLWFGEGELCSGGFCCLLIFVDVFEVIIGVVFFDGGFEVV